MRTVNFARLHDVKVNIDVIKNSAEAQRQIFVYTCRIRNRAKCCLKCMDDCRIV